MKSKKFSVTEFWFSFGLNEGIWKFEKNIEGKADLRTP